MAAARAFREGDVTPIDPLDTTQWNDHASRKLRYALLWSLFDNSAYRDLHAWSKGLRATYGLYSYIRNIHNPAYRLGTFHQTHIQGGPLDLIAGDGKKVASALPIVMDSESQQLRAAIAQLWQWSVWSINKDVWTLNGTIMGDAPLEVVDDVARGKVYLKVMHPGKVKTLDCDPQGNVKGYTLEYVRADPRRPVVDRPGMSSSIPPTVTYTEQVTRDGDDVVYRTFLNSQAWPWNDQPAEWTRPYGFVPLVMVKHQDVGLDFGWSELHAGLSKFREVDDIASALDDQIRKAVNAPWLFNFAKANSATTIARTTPTTENPQPGRGELPAMYVNMESAKGQALIADLDIAAVGERIAALQDELKHDYPELDTERHTGSGDASGRALRYAQQPVTAKVLQRRSGYDSALVRAQQMAIAIAGERGYPGFEGFGLDSFDAGALEHSIGERPVFAVDKLDQIEEDQAFWQAAKTAADAGYPLDLYLEEKGFSPEKIGKVMQGLADKQAQDQANLEMQLAAKGRNELAGS